MKKIISFLFLLSIVTTAFGQSPIPDTVFVFQQDTVLSCHVDSLFLFAGEDYSSYLWDTGDTTLGIWVMETGTYRVTVDANTGNEQSDSVYVNFIHASIVQNDTMICYGDTITLNITQKLPDCLIAYYPLNGNSNDESGHGYNLFPFNTILVPDRFGHPRGAYSFNGKNSYLFGSIGLHTGDLAVALWFRTPDTSLWYPENMLPTIFDYGNGQLRTALLGLDPDFIEGNDVGKVSVDHFNGVGAPDNFQFETSVKPAFAQWHHLYVVFDTSAAPSTIWIDGMRQAQDVTPAVLNPVEDLIFFGRSDSIRRDESYFVGRLDEISIYSCPLDSAEIEALYKTGTMYNYTTLWSTGDTLSSIAVAPDTTTTYYVSVSDGLNSCTDSVTVRVNPEIKLDLTQIDIGCPGEEKAKMLAHVTGGTSPYVITWDNRIKYLQGDTLALGLRDSIDYAITITDTMNCTLAQTFQVDALPAPQVKFSYAPENVYIQNPVVTFTDETPDAVAWFWDFGDTVSTSTLQNPVHTYATVNSFPVKLIVTGSNGCKDSLVQVVNVQEVKLVIPNAFTPNGDGINDTYVVTDLDKYISNYFVVYNRWGKKVFEKTNYVSGDWDGGNLADGTYFFVLRCTGYFSVDEFKGTINIIRGPRR